MQAACSRLGQGRSRRRCRGGQPPAHYRTTRPDGSQRHSRPAVRAHGGRRTTVRDHHPAARALQSCRPPAHLLCPDGRGSRKGGAVSRDLERVRRWWRRRLGGWTAAAVQVPQAKLAKGGRSRSVRLRLSRSGRRAPRSAFHSALRGRSRGAQRGRRAGARRHRDRPWPGSCGPRCRR